MNKIIFLFFLLPLICSAQVVEEVIQIDTTFEKIEVIYKPLVENTPYYFKKSAFFATDTSQLAIEKYYTSYGQNGLYKVYYPDGRLKIKTVFSNDKINGDWTYYDPKGIIITKGRYRNGIKHGYWAYKSLHIYGRYKRGYKNGKWKRFDPNQKKYLSHYRMGVLKAGEGYVNDYVTSPKDSISKNIPNKKDSLFSVPKEFEKELINEEQKQVVFFLRTNILLRKALKKHFSTSIKRSLAFKKMYAKNGDFQFVINPSMENLKLDFFLKDQEDGRIVVPYIDEILRDEKQQLILLFNGEKGIEDSLLFEASTKKESSVRVTFSEINYQLMRLNVNWIFEEENTAFRMLLYFNDKGVLKGVEYEK
jgi:antitoxin component YwqK of YwqJK toxin-antitoxin module